MVLVAVDRVSPDLGLLPIHPEKEFPGWNMATPYAYQLTLRQGSTAAAPLWFSGAPLPYHAHVEHLHRVEQALLAISSR